MISAIRKENGLCRLTSLPPKFDFQSVCDIPTRLTSSGRTVPTDHSNQVRRVHDFSSLACALRQHTPGAQADSQAARAPTLHMNDFHWRHPVSRDRTHRRQINVSASRFAGNYWRLCPVNNFSSSWTVVGRPLCGRIPLSGGSGRPCPSQSPSEFDLKLPELDAVRQESMKR